MMQQTEMKRWGLQSCPVGLGNAAFLVVPTVVFPLGFLIHVDYLCNGALIVKKHNHDRAVLRGARDEVGVNRLLNVDGHLFGGEVGLTVRDRRVGCVLRHPLQLLGAELAQAHLVRQAARLLVVHVRDRLRAALPRLLKRVDVQRDAAAEAEEAGQHVALLEGGADACQQLVGLLFAQVLAGHALSAFAHNEVVLRTREHLPQRRVHLSLVQLDGAVQRDLPDLALLLLGDLLHAVSAALPRQHVVGVDRLALVAPRVCGEDDALLRLNLYEDVAVRVVGHDVGSRGKRVARLVGEQVGGRPVDVPRQREI
eukprot:Rhum_TRINITY_DN762_c0_g1::Rhum_TRINITY_DN762_c0_g1_i1::g.2334::m.2334